MNTTEFVVLVKNSKHAISTPGERAAHTELQGCESKRIHPINRNALDRHEQRQIGTIFIDVLPIFCQYLRKGVLQAVRRWLLHSAAGLAQSSLGHVRIR